MVCRPDISTPVIQFIRRFTTPQRAENCGVWYRRILARIQALLCVATCETEPATIATTAVGVVGSTIREASFYAVKTVIRNTGANDAFIYEGDALIYMLAAGMEWEMPVAGKLKLEAEALSGTTNIEVTTFVRCTCGVVPVLEEGDDEEGGFLV